MASLNKAGKKGPAISGVGGLKGDCSGWIAFRLPPLLPLADGLGRSSGRTRRRGVLDGGFKYFLFSPRFGEDFQFDEHIFQMG